MQKKTLMAIPQETFVLGVMAILNPVSGLKDPLFTLVRMSKTRGRNRFFVVRLKYRDGILRRYAP